MSEELVVTSSELLADPPQLDFWYEDLSGAYWFIRWTGWKTIPASQDLAAQYLAYPVDGGASRTVDGLRPMIYSSFPGDCSVFRRGDMFDIAIKPEQIDFMPEWPNEFSLKTDLTRAQAWAFSRLKSFIEKAAKIDWHGNSQLLRVPTWDLNRAIEAA